MILPHSERVSVSAVQAIRDRFVYSSLKINKNFFGFLAMSRCSDRKSIGQYNKKINATIKIQALIKDVRNGAILLVKSRNEVS